MFVYPLLLLDGVGGASDDWAKDHGIKYTSTIEMRGNSFVLPPEQIIPNAQGSSAVNMDNLTD